MVNSTDYKEIAVFGFAAIVAWKLLTFFLNQYTKKLDCMKDTLIQVLNVLEDLRKTRIPKED